MHCIQNTVSGFPGLSGIFYVHFPVLFRTVLIEWLSNKPHFHMHLLSVARGLGDRAWLPDEFWHTRVKNVAIIWLIFHVFPGIGVARGGAWGA